METYFKTELGKLYNGDCNEVMASLIDDKIKVNGVITSPPYNIIRPNSADRGYDLYKDGMTNKEYMEWTINLFWNYEDLLLKNGVVLYNMSYGTENTTAMNLTVASIIENTNFTLADIIVWKKQSATPNNVSSNKMTRICEFIYVFCRKNEFKTFQSNKKILNLRDTGQPIYENVFNFIAAPNNDYSQELNKATFSTKLVNELIDRYFRKGDIILDNFSGTGTTAAASEQNNINWIGIELSKDQCEHTKQRFKKGIQQLLF